MIRIRECSDSDIPLIQKLASEIWPGTYRSILTEGQIGYMMDMMYSTESLLEQMQRKKHRFMIIYAEDQPLGYASFSREKKGDHDFLRLHKIYLDARTRGKGYGLQFMDHLKSMAGSVNAAWMELNVNKNNPAIGFYLRAGFEIAGEEKIDIGSGYIMDDYIMQMKMHTPKID